MTWQVGASLPQLVIDPVRADLMVPMAEILADPNPIHLDADVVRELGYGDQVINQGPSNCGYVINMLQAAFPNGRVTAFKARFLGNVFAGDRVVAGGMVTAMNGDESKGQATVAVELRNGHGMPVLDGIATVSFPAAY